MFRTNRYFDKNQRKNNFFGEDESIEFQNGKVIQLENYDHSPPQDEPQDNEEESG